MSPKLRRAYLATAYEAGGAVARIGRRSPGMDSVLAGLGVRRAAFLTAWNPRSRRMPEGWNRRMQARLVQRLRGVSVLPAHGSWRGWSEEHVLARLDVRRAAVLARLFRQRAIVAVGNGRKARAIVLS